MLYFEFLEGTGRTEDRLTWVVYKGLERIYDNTPKLSKQDVYRYAVPLLRDLAELVNDAVHDAKLKLVEMITDALTNTANEAEADEEDYYEYEDMESLFADPGFNSPGA